MSWPTADTTIVRDCTGADAAAAHQTLTRLAIDRGWTPPGHGDVLMAYARFAGLVQHRAGRADNLAELLDGIADAVRDLRAATGPLEAETRAGVE